MHLYMLAYMWVLPTSVSSILQYNEAMDIRSKPTLVPHGHHLFVCPLLVCLLSCSLVCLLTYLLAFLFLCLPCLSRLFALCLFHMLFASFPSNVCLLVSFLCLCMYTHGAWMHGARARSPRHKQKGCRGEHVDMSQLAMFRRFRGLVLRFFLMD